MDQEGDLYYPRYSLATFIVRVTNDHSLFKPRIEVQCFPLSVSLSHPENKCPTRISRWNARDHNDMSRRERSGRVIAKGVLGICELDHGIRERKRLAVIDLMNRLDVLIHSYAANLLNGYSEFEGAVLSPIDTYMETIIAHENVELKDVA